MTPMRYGVPNPAADLIVLLIRINSPPVGRFDGPPNNLGYGVTVAQLTLDQFV